MYLCNSKKFRDIYQYKYENKYLQYIYRKFIDYFTIEM